MNENMLIWDEVRETAPSATKRANVDGRNQTSINGTYMAKRATEMFGPIGIGWGYDIEEERFDDTGPIYEAETKEIICHGRNHTIKLKLWYVLNDTRGELIQYGHTKYIYKSKYGFSVDYEAPKKSVTDAMKKCLSLLGFSADIFLGQFDNNDYVDAQIAKERLETAESKAEEITKQELERKEWILNSLRLMEESKTISMLEGIYKTSMRKAVARNDHDAQKRFDKTKDKKLTELKKDE